MSIPKSLQDALRERRVVPFVGAGVSMAVQLRDGTNAFPSWKQLLLAAAERLEQETKIPDANLIRSSLDVDPPKVLFAADHARKELGAVWYKFLKEKFDVKFSAIDETSLELARRVWSLGSNLIITTNYDEVLNWASTNSRDLDNSQVTELVELLQNNITRSVVWHLHGRISNASQIILTQDSYDRLYPGSGGEESNYKAAFEVLRNQIASKTLLFVGFSLEDDYVAAQLKSIEEIFRGSAGPHFALVRESEAQRVRDLKLGVLPLTFSDFGRPQLKLMKELSTIIEDDSSGRSDGQILLPQPMKVPDYSPHNYIFYVPFRQKGDQLVGHTDTLEKVRNQLTTGKRTAIGQTAAFRGLGGLGKTQLAVEYAYRYRHEYPNGVIWINADQDIDAQLIEIGHRARWIAPESEHQYKKQIAQQRIRSHSDCLVVFDNLDDQSVIGPYLPEPDANPHILVTSRIDHSDFLPVPLDPLDHDRSLELLFREAGRRPATEDEELAAAEIVDSLGGLPLALELAGAYLAHLSSLSFHQYKLMLLTDLKGSLPANLSSFTKHEADLYRTLRVSEALLTEEPLLGDMLDLLTWSGSAPMSRNLISTLLASSDNARLIRALAVGVELRLLQRSKDSDSYSLHRLVAQVRRGDISLAERLGWASVITKRLGDWFQSKRKDFDQLPEFEAEIDHLVSWQRNAERLHLSEASRLMWLQAYPAYHRGNYSDSRDYIILATELFEQSRASDLELKANLLNDSAFINSSLGYFENVLEINLEALSIRRELFGDRHPDIAVSLDLIGSCYGGRGDLSTALKYSEDALRMRKEFFDDPNAQIASSLQSVGHWHDELGNFNEALDYFEQALDMRRRLIGGRHPDIASSLNRIGTWYGTQGQFDKAVEYTVLALTMRREVFGERAPDIATSLSNLGSWYGHQGHLNLAFEYSELALSMTRELLGDTHPRVATTLSNIGNCYNQLGNPLRAFECAEQALAMRRKLFGERHPDVALSLKNVGSLYSQKGNYSEALVYAKAALDIQRELFGEEHYLVSESSLGVAYHLSSLSRRPEAYALVVEALRSAPQNHASREGLIELRDNLLSSQIRKGFRQPKKNVGGRVGKKRR